MRPVILIGGPYDGKSTDVTDDLPLYWRIIDPWRPKVYETIKADVVPNEVTMSVSVYEHVLMHWPKETNTKVELYRYLRSEP